MSQMPEEVVAAATPSMRAATLSSTSEKDANSREFAISDKSGPTPPAPKLRSCSVCRARKVRCDKLSPCSQCRRANIPCVVPSSNRPPRWARRLEHVANNATSSVQASQGAEPTTARVMERLRSLEALVTELRSQLQQGNDATTPAGSSPAGADLPGSSGHKQFGRLVHQDPNRSRYVSSGFWSKVNDEIEGLKLDNDGLEASDSDVSEDNASTRSLASIPKEFERTPLERHTFLFRHNLTTLNYDLREFQPLPSQIPFLFDVFTENVNRIVRVIHVPTVAKMLRDSRGTDMTSVTPANRALMFAIYYAAISSMEEDDVMTNFAVTKAELNVKYRLGLERALGEADFLNSFDIVLVQAFAIFLFLLRRHESPRFVWMMTSLLIRMGQALGLHRDGTQFERLSPYDIEMRRRLWWAICMLDVRASEDQGTENMIAFGSSDTKFPLNINDAEIELGTSNMPTAREGVTDMTLALVSYELVAISKQMMAQDAKGGVPNMEEQSVLLTNMYQKLDRAYLQHSVESGNIAYWVVVTATRLLMAKMSLLVYLPVLFSSPSDDFSEEVRTKLLIAALEVAEYNHALNAEQACRQWRWIYQTYTHWYAIVYILIEISRRTWSPIIERAWVALHSPWLIPAQSPTHKDLRVWIPLKKLIAKAQKHRDAELERLGQDPEAANMLEMADQRLPTPASPGLFPTGSDVTDLYCEQWRQLLTRSEKCYIGIDQSGRRRLAVVSPLTQPGTKTQSAHSAVVHSTGGSGSTMVNHSISTAFVRSQGKQDLTMNASVHQQAGDRRNGACDFGVAQPTMSSYNTPCAVSTNWSTGAPLLPWLWADADPSVNVFADVDVDGMNVDMDLDKDQDWYNWIESAK